jgi:hypothetical protein
MAVRQKRPSSAFSTRWRLLHPLATLYRPLVPSLPLVPQQTALGFAVLRHAHATALILTKTS